MTPCPRFVISVLLILMLSGSKVQSAADKKAAGKANETVAIQTVVAEVKEALSNVQTELANKQLPPLKSVKLTLQTVASKKGGVKISFWVITVGGTIQKEATQEIVIELTPPKAGNPKNISSESFTQALEDAIVSAAQGVSDAGNGPVPLQLNSLSVSLSFTVSTEGSAGAKVALAPVTAELTGQKDAKTVQKLDLTYGNPSDKSNDKP